MSRQTPAKFPWLAIALWLFSLTAPILAAKLDPASEEFYHMVRHFMTRNEEKLFHKLSTPEFRQEFIKAFWEIRDPDPGTEENEFRDAVEERFDFVNKFLREGNRPGWDTARGRIYMVLGPPDMMNAGSTPGLSNLPPNTMNSAGIMANTLVWPYQELQLYVVFVDREGFGVYDLDMINTSPRLIEFLKRGKTQFIYEGTGAEDHFLKLKAEIEPAKDRLLITIDANELRFEIDAGGGYTARIHLAVNLYLPDGTIVTQKDDRRIVLDLEMQKKKQLQVEWTIPLKKGKNQVDLLVQDQVGGKSIRQFLAVKKN
jgi:GWxTD domain-containing protein